MSFHAILLHGLILMFLLKFNFFFFGGSISKLGSNLVFFLNYLIKLSRPELPFSPLLTFFNQFSLKKILLLFKLEYFYFFS